LTLELAFLMINHIMKKVKAFFYTLSRSLIPNNKYYKKITKTGFSFSLKYLLGLIFLLNLMAITLISWHYSYPRVKKVFTSVIDSLRAYPNDLIISVQNDILFSTLDRPYFFWLKDGERQRLLLVVDQSAEDNKIAIYNSTILLTPTSIVTQIGRKSNTIPIAAINGILIDKKTIDRWASGLTTVKNNLVFYYSIGVAFLFIAMLTTSLIVTFIYLFVVSFVAYLYFKIFKKRHFHFRKVLQISFHANTFPYILDYSFIFIPLPTQLPYLNLFAPQFFPFIFLIILFFFTVNGVWKAYHEQ